VAQLAIAMLCLTGAVWAGFKLFYGVSDDWVGLGIGVFWAAVNGGLAASVVAMVTRPWNRRQDFRFFGAVVVRYRTLDEEPALAGFGIGADLSEQGMALMIGPPPRLGGRLELRWDLGPRRIACEALVQSIGQSRTVDGLYRCGMRFDGLSREEKDAITTFCFTRMLPDFFERFDPPRPLLTRLVRWCYDRRRIRRQAARVAIHLPVAVQGDPVHYTVTEDISRQGVALLTAWPLTVGEAATIAVFTPFGTVVADVAVRSCREAAEPSYTVGAEFVRLSPAGQDILERVCGGRSGRQTA
jgi:cellulose synthase (UDP-forming)